MQGLNKVQLIGHLGKNPEYLEFENGNKLAKFSVATTESYKDDAGKICVFNLSRTEMKKVN